MGSKFTFTSQEIATGKTLYFILVACIIATIGGLAYTIADLLQPTNKFTLFIALPPGAIIATIGVGLFVLFLLLINFYRLYRRGTYGITKVLFAAKQLYKQMQIQTLAKIMTGGLMVAIFFIAAGLVVLGVQLAIAVPSQSSFLQFVAHLTIGEWVLLISACALVVTIVTIAFAWLWNVGNIFFARRLLKTPGDE